MDGTLVDTEPYWLAAETELVHAWGGHWSLEDGLQLVGSSLSNSARVLVSRGVDLDPGEIVQLLTDRVLEQLETEVPWRPGSREMLEQVHAAGIPMALVTMSIRRMADSIAASAGFPAFGAVVAGDEVDNGKPDPEAYLRAATALEVDISDCLAIEDSEFGVAAAVASGATTLALPLHVPLPDSPAYTKWETLEGRALDELFGLHAVRVSR
ncbi:MAG TPA: HAD family phosphatase [Pseudolysinimonas sp.]|nr:HAD family phosphatase [Pseudolysinimonas sp.]